MKSAGSREAVVPPGRAGRNPLAAARAPGVLLASLALICAGSLPALGWSDQGHMLITEEAVRRLPEPLRSLFSEKDDLQKLQTASVAPDERRKKESPLYSPAEMNSKHFFDIDALSKEGPPYKSFPRRLDLIEKQFDSKLLDDKGRAPWAIRSALRDLTQALAFGRTEEVFRQAGDLSHYAADIHMPFHTTDNYDGRLSGNSGIHKALEIGLVNRNRDVFVAELQKDRREVLYLDAVEPAMIEWIIQANARVPLCLEADTEARRRSGYNPKEFENPKVDEAGKVVEPSDLDNLASERAKPYYAALKEELDNRGSPMEIQMREAAVHVAQLFYTAWTDAGKPLSLSESAARPEAPEFAPTWPLLVGFLILLLALLPRRKPAAKG